MLFPKNSIFSCIEPHTDCVVSFAAIVVVGAEIMGLLGAGSLMGPASDGIFATGFDEISFHGESAGRTTGGVGFMYHWRDS